MVGSDKNQVECQLAREEMTSNTGTCIEGCYRGKVLNRVRNGLLECLAVL